MNPHLTKIAYILDRSGSMGSMQQAAITGFNRFVSSQLDVAGEARLTLVQFDDCYEVHVLALPIEQVPQLDTRSYVPRGSTALLDAIGRTIVETHARLQTLPADQLPGKVVIAVFTDACCLIEADTEKKSWIGLGSPVASEKRTLWRQP